jgi:Transglycosylase SLT domain
MGPAVRLARLEWVGYRAVKVWLAVTAGGLACSAHAGFICRDPWLNTYRLQSPVSGLSCEVDAMAAREAPREPTRTTSTPTGTLTLTSTGAQVSGRLLLRTERFVSVHQRRHDEALDALIAIAAARYGHTANLLRAIVHVESRFNAAAVSPKGAIGLMQLMPDTARELGVTDPATRLFDPAVNLDAGARLLRQLLDRFEGRPDLAIAAYNAGAGAVLRHGREMPPYPETQAYVRDVTAEFARLTR